MPLIVLFLARALDGITGGNVSVANAYLADITEEERRNENFGKMAVSSNLGFILGPALAGLLGATVWGEALPVLAALMISFFATFIIAFNLPESKPCLLRRDPEKVNVRKVFGQEHKPCFEMKGAEKLKTKHVFRMRNIPYLMVLYFLIFLGFNLFYTAFPIHAVKSLNWSVAGMGTFFSVLSLMMVIVQGPVLSKVSKRCSDSFLVVVGSVILGTNFIMLMSRHIVLIYLAGGLFAIGNGVMWPSLLSIISRSAGDKFQGSVQGIASSFGSLASIIGLVVGGILYGILGGRVFLVSAVTIYVVFFLSFRLVSSGNRASEVSNRQ
jgi:MFS family permease